MDDSIDPKGGATIAFLREKDAVHYAFTECNYQDTFYKKRGRIQAGGRLNSKNYRLTLPCPSELTLKEVIQNLKEAYLEYKSEFNPHIRDFLGR